MSGTGPCILCVDDEAVNLMLLRALLEPRGYDVITAANGNEALETISRRQVDLVLLDVMMPQLNGYDVCSAIKNDEKSRDIPVILITALRSKDDRIKGIEAGAEDFISKPFDHQEVLARVKMLMRIKGLHERLQRSYDNITDLIAYGETMAKTFDPLNFDFLTGIDDIVGKIIRREGSSTEKPEMVLIGLSDKSGGREWLLYRSEEHRLRRFKLDVDRKGFQVMNTNGSRSDYYNAGDAGMKQIEPIVAKVEALHGAVGNAAGYHSQDICIQAFNYGREVTSYDAAVLKSLVVHSLFLRSLSEQVRDTDDAFAYTVHALARASEVNDEDTGNHIVRVGEYCGVIAERLGMSEKFRSIIRIQALLHDVGKIHIPPEILKKPDKLTPEEFAEIRKHPEYGVRIVGSHVRFTLARTIALTHHERWDGSGYPFGLCGEQIPIEGRIMNLADIYDALRNKRVYKPAFDHRTTCEILLQGDGRTLPRHFDPRVLQAFRESSSLFEEIFAKFAG